MTTILPPASVTVMTAEELAAFAKRMTTLTITPDERPMVLGLLQQACEALGSTANRIAQDVTDTTPFGGQLGTRDGWLPAVAVLVDELSNTGARLAEARDGFEDAAKAAEELAAEQSAEPAEEPFDRLAAADMTSMQREAYTALAARLAAQNGVTR